MQRIAREWEWEFYLAICQVSFKRSDLVVDQMQAARPHRHARGSDVI